MTRVENYLAVCGLRLVEGKGDFMPCIATNDGKIVQWGHEPIVSLIQTVLDLSDSVQRLEDDLYRRDR